WLRGTGAARGYACDARVVPVVTGHLDPVALAALTAAAREFLTAPAPGAAGGTLTRPGDTVLRDAVLRDTVLRDAVLRDTVLRDTVLRYAVGVLSGPGGLAAALRAGTSGPHAAGVSLPLDVGAATATVPLHLWRAVIIRDRHCAFPGCAQRPAGCQVHHVIPRSAGGPTALTNMVLLCTYHHLIAIHRQGWKLVLHGDGTTTATSPGGHRIYHSHSPPAAAAA
ncbi:MAG: HNH endonuclease signature motif containing protein, partial [Streptosporangiaceae bacterium]